MKAYQVSVLSAPLALIAALLLVDFGVATAGVEPSPFQPEINQLGAAENVINSAGLRIVKTMDKAADPQHQSPNVNGALNRLDAINKQLVSVDDMVASMIEEVMGFEPTPFNDLPDLVPPLSGVQGAALNIVDEIKARMGFEPSPFVPEFEDQLRSVQTSAQTISIHMLGYIEQINCDVDCLAIEDREDCESFACCAWISTDNNEDPNFGYCDIDTEYQPGF